MQTETPNVTFDLWSDLTVRAKGLSEEQLLDLLESEEVTFDDFLQAGPIHLVAVVAALNAGDRTLADALSKRSPTASSASALPTEDDRRTFEADETLPIRAAFVATPAVPFSGESTPAQVAAMLSPVEARVRADEPGPDETAMMPIAAFVPPKTGTFRDQLGALVVPLLSLDEYSELRARLTVFGETHATTLERFGVAGKGVREALALKFADYFQRAPAAQARFLAALEPAIVRARAERDK